MAYTLNEMYDTIDIAVKDADGNEYSDLLKTAWLNKAQDHMLSLVNGDYVVELHTVDASESPTTGVYAMSGLSYSVYRKHLGIMGVRNAATGGIFCEYVNFEEYKRLVSDAYTFVATSPLYYMRGSSIYILPTSITSIDVYYMREPCNMDNDVASGSIADGTVYTVNEYTTVKYPASTGTEYTHGQSFTGTTANGSTYDVTGTGTVTVDCELEEELQEMILDYAKYLACLNAGNNEGAADNQTSAYTQADVVNKKADMERTANTSISRMAAVDYRNNSVAGGGDR